MDACSKTPSTSEGIFCGVVCQVSLGHGLSGDFNQTACSTSKTIA
jgi:hypothetical protein